MYSHIWALNFLVLDHVNKYVLMMPCISLLWSKVMHELLFRT